MKIPIKNIILENIGKQVGYTTLGTVGGMVAGGLLGVNGGAFVDGIRLGYEHPEINNLPDGMVHNIVKNYTLGPDGIALDAMSGGIAGGGIAGGLYGLNKARKILKENTMKFPIKKILLESSTYKTIKVENIKLVSLDELGLDKKFKMKVDKKNDSFIKNNPKVLEYFNKPHFKEVFSNSEKELKETKIKNYNTIIIDTYSATQDMNMVYGSIFQNKIPKDQIIWFYGFGNGDYLGFMKQNNEIVEYSHELDTIFNTSNKKIYYKG